MVDDIMAILGRDIAAQERAFLPSTRSVHTATSLVAGDGRPRCCYWEQIHTSVSCNMITDVAHHRSIYIEENREVL